MTSKLYYDPARPSAFSTVEKLRAAAAASKKDKKVVRTWLEKQHDYTLHRQVRKRFPRNPYSVTNVMDVWECDLVDVQFLCKYNGGHKYILTVIDVFSKYLYMVPLKVKTGASTAAAFECFAGPQVPTPPPPHLGSNRQGQRVFASRISGSAETLGHPVSGVQKPRRQVLRCATGA